MSSPFEILQTELKKYLPDEKIEEIHAAYLLAENAHKDQQRSSGESYITHPVEVATILAKMHLDSASIIAALLHDVLEDTDTSKAAIEKQFGHEIVELVEGVTKLAKIKFESHLEAQAENFRKMMIAMVQDIRVIILKLADRLHNISTLHYLKPEKRRRIARETLEIYAPIANRLGMHALRIQFEEYSFQGLYPWRYAVIKQAASKALGTRIEVLKVIESSLSNALQKGHLPSYQLNSREKRFYSIYAKMKKKHLKFSEIMDVYGFRLVVDTIDDCYRALGIAHNLYKPFPRRFKDYIAIPKANGYQSLHTVLFGPYGVPIEVQIRTHEMDHLAENGIAAHWLYKTEETESSPSHLRMREWMKSLLDIQQSTGNPLEFIENVKVDLFPDAVYVFTPKGDILELPNGATIIDLAYAIHSDIGNTCVAAKVDHRITPLSSRLRTGQTVEIITDANARPSPAWLDFVTTGKARSHMRNYLKAQQQGEVAQFGKRLLDNALEHIHLSLDKIPQKNIEAVLQTTHLNSLDELYEQIGLSNQIAPLLAKRFAEGVGAAKPASSTTTPLVIKGTEGMAVSFAKCCHPIPGDPIEGVLIAGQGLEVHHADCRSLIELRRQPDKCIPLRWEEDIHGEFEIDLHIEVLDMRGVCAKLALAIAQAEGNIDSLNIIERNGKYSLVSVILTVHSSDHLNRIMNAVRKCKHVMHVERYYNTAKQS